MVDERPQPSNDDHVDTESDERQKTARKWIVIALVILTSLSTVAATLAVWLNQTAFNTDRFVATIESALDDPEVVDAIGVYISDEAMTALMIEDRVNNALTELDNLILESRLNRLDLSLSSLAPAISSGIETRINSVVDDVVASSAFQAILLESVRLAHIAAVAIIREDVSDISGVTVADGVVTLNLIPAIGELLKQLDGDLGGFADVDLPADLSGRVDEAINKLSSALGARLPDDFGQLTFVPDDRLVALRQTAEQLDRFVWVSVILTLALGAATLILSTNRRRTGFQLVFGVGAGFVVGLILLNRVEDSIVEGLNDLGNPATVQAVVSDLLSSLRTWAGVLIFATLVVGIVGYIADKSSAGRAASKEDGAETGPSDAGDVERWVSEHYDLVRVAGVVLALIALFITGPGNLAILLIALALVAYLWAAAAAKDRVSAVENSATVKEPDHSS